MTDTKVYARCSNPKVDYLTGGKLYEVLMDDATIDGTFVIERDNGETYWFGWENSMLATWTRVEQQDPPQWALDKAAKAADKPNYEYVARHCTVECRLSVEAHAATLAKYETEPVDPVLEKAEDLICINGIFKSDLDEADYNCVVGAVMEALRLPAMGADK